jgi:hypothetical protein
MQTVRKLRDTKSAVRISRPTIAQSGENHENSLSARLYGVSHRVFARSVWVSHLGGLARQFVINLHRKLVHKFVDALQTAARATSRRTVYFQWVDQHFVSRSRRMRSLDSKSLSPARAPKRRQFRKGWASGLGLDDDPDIIAGNSVKGKFFRYF